MSSKDKWFGIKRIKKKYQPKPYTRKDIRGDIVPLSKQAEAAAEYLEKFNGAPVKQTRKHNQPPDIPKNTMENTRGKHLHPENTETEE